MIINCRSPAIRMCKNSTSEHFETSFMDTEEDGGKRIFHKDEKFSENPKDIILKNHEIINTLSHSKTLGKH